MKVSVSLPDEDVRYVDEYAQRVGAPSRSSVIHDAIELLRLSEMEEAYVLAWDEWGDSEDRELWNGTSGDGLIDAPR